MANVSHQRGGGISASNSALTLFKDELIANAAGYEGGGIASVGGVISLSTGSILSNTALGPGGGIYLDTNDAFLDKNAIAGNFGREGGGLYVIGGVYVIGGRPVMLRNNVISHNKADTGGGLYLGANVTLVNSMIADNLADTLASGIYLREGDLQATHTTLAHNTGGDGSGLYIDSDPAYNVISLTNTIVASQTVGIADHSSRSVAFNGTLWSGNDTNWVSYGMTDVNNYYGDPLFVDPVAGNYHIGPGSAAIDRGVRTNAFFDIDNQPRVNTPDLGADEYWAPGALKQMYLPILIKN